MSTTTKPKTQTLKVRMEPQLAYAIEYLAREMDISQSALIRSWAVAGLEVAKRAAEEAQLERRSRTLRL